MRPRSLFALSLAVGLGSAGQSAAQSGLTVTQHTTFQAMSLTSGDLVQTISIRGTDREKIVTTGRMKILFIGRDATSTELIRLDQGQVYQIDDKKKSYTTTSLADERARLQEAQQKLEQQSGQGDDDDIRYTVVTNGVQRTGQKRTINGFQTEEAVLKMTVIAENTKTHEKGPVFHMTGDLWLDPSQKAAAAANLAFSRAYAAQLGLDPRTTGNPYGRWMKDLYGEVGKLDGYPIVSTITVTGVDDGSKPQPTQTPAGPSASEVAANPVGAALGGLMRRAAKPKPSPTPNPATAPSAAAATSGPVLFSSTTEVTSISATAPPATAFDLPIGYKAK